MKDKNEESFKDWYEKQGQNIKNAQHPIHLARRTWKCQQAKIDELEKEKTTYLEQISDLSDEVNMANDRYMGVAEREVAPLDMQNMLLLKVLREAVNTIEAAELDVDEFFSFSEVYLSIKHLLEEDKK